jgi:hypothetical protein
MPLEIDDIRDWSGRVLTKAKRLFFSRKVQPIVFTYPAQGGETQSKVYSGIGIADDGGDYLKTGNRPSGPVASVVAGDATITVGAANDVMQIDTASYFEGTSGGGFNIALNNGASAVYIGEWHTVAASGMYVIFSTPIVIPGGEGLAIVNGDANDNWYLWYHKRSA